MTLFVAISGFALYHRYAASVLRRERPPSPAAFLRDRTLRLAPPFLLAALVTPFALAATRQVAVTPPPGGAGGALVTPGFSWAVAALLALYGLVPLQARCARRGLRQQRGRAWAGCCLATPPLVLAAAAVAGLAAIDRPAVVARTGAPESWVTPVGTVLGVVTAFALGMVAAVAALALGLRRLRRSSRAAWRWTVALLLTAGVACGMADAPAHQVGWALAAAAAIVLLAAPGGTPPVAGARLLLSVTPLAHVGRLSFGLWLWHLPVIAVLLQQWPALRYGDPAGLGLALACVGLATWLAAEATYWLLERPLRRLRARRTGDTPRRHRPRLPAFLPPDPLPAPAPEAASRFDIRAPVTLLVPAQRSGGPSADPVGHGLTP